MIAVAQRATAKPQWSPSRSDGMTLLALGALWRHRVAAMEPVQIGRDDDGSRGRAGRGLHAAMEPVQIGRDDWMSGSGSRRATTPQWSPSRSDGMTPLPGAWARRPRSRRNGARPDRTG